MIITTHTVKRKRTFPNCNVFLSFFLSFPFLFFRPRLHSFFLSLSFSPFSFSVLLHMSLHYTLLLSLLRTGCMKTRDTDACIQCVGQSDYPKVSQPFTVQHSVLLLGQLLCIFNLSLCLSDTPLPFRMVTEKPEEVR